MRDFRWSVFPYCRARAHFWCVFGLLLCPILVGAEVAQFRIVLDSRAQTIEGFGSSINAWSAPYYALYYDDAFTEFAVHELGMSVFRLQMWGGVSTKEIEDWRDIDYRDFKWTGDGLRGKMNVDWAKRVREANPEVKIIGTVWSAPGWMKENGSRTGTASGYLLSETRDFDADNRLREDRYLHFAKYIVEWARYMESQGTPFFAISLQNELMFTQWYESTLVTPEEYARLLQVTGEMFDRERVRRPLFFGPEDMTMATYHDEERHKPYIDAIFDSEAKRYFDAFATHGYTDGVASDRTRATVAYWESIESFGLPYWITEGGTGEHTWPHPVTDGVAPRIHYAVAESNVSLFCGWQLTGEKGEGSEHEFMTWDRPTKKTYAAMHYWRHVRPGAVRIEVEALRQHDETELLISAFDDAKRRKIVVVVINPSSKTCDAEFVVEGLESNAATDHWQFWRTDEVQNHREFTVPIEGDWGFGNRFPAYSISTFVLNLEE